MQWHANSLAKLKGFIANQKSSEKTAYLPDSHLNLMALSQRLHRWLKIKELTHNQWVSSYKLLASAVNIDVQVYVINDQMMSAANCPSQKVQTLLPEPHAL